ncbi:hypothetical protein [Halorubrum saccharovorum]|uniref:hypothetical protein n=1 Tax=Halorubrum saccharovorum TaxID=2248 RepID=UPI001F209FBC|nr:hypothetical protein [Halorubrum saccharovorum]
MAHKLAHKLQSMGDEPPDDGRDESASGGVTRRGYVRLGGAALATLTALTGKTAAVAARRRTTRGVSNTGSGSAGRALRPRTR